MWECDVIIVVDPERRLGELREGRVGGVRTMASPVPGKELSGVAWVTKRAAGTKLGAALDGSFPPPLL